MMQAQPRDEHEEHIELARQLRAEDSGSAARRIAALDAATAVAALELLNAPTMNAIVAELAPERRRELMDAAPEGLREQWLIDRAHAADTVGSLMETTHAVFRPETRVADAIESLRAMVQHSFISYGFLTDANGYLKGVFAFRELLFAQPEQTLADVSIMNPFWLRADTQLMDAMQQVLTRHFPAYPVCDEAGRLLGIVRGHVLFEAQAFEISAQPGKMQGVDREERLSTPWSTSLRSRHPWLQLNLLTAFIAAGVVGLFQDTIDRVIVLAAFLPVLAGQSGNTGCQALAVTLRGITMGEIANRSTRSLLLKEAILGIGNGCLIGLAAGAGMVYYAVSQQMAEPLLLGIIVWTSMTIACLASGLSGVLIPLALRHIGADPATASSIFLTTMTDVVSMGLFLGLATILIP